MPTRGSPEKRAHITLLTGYAGAGKSTLAERLAPHFDLVVGTDTGRAEGGAYVSPSQEEKARLRAERGKQILEAHAAGKRVLVEGFPDRFKRMPGVVEQADALLVLNRPWALSVLDVLRRSR